MRSDGEPSIIDLKQELQLMREEETMLEESPTGESQSNGASEQTVKEVTAMARTWKSSVEDRYGVKLAYDHPIIAWMIKYSGDVITRHKIGTDGKTPYERLKGYKSSARVVPFVESVLRQPLKTKENKSDRCKLDDSYEEGIWAGINNNNGAYIILTDRGVYQARSIRRRPDSEKHDQVLMASVRGKPWDERDEGNRTADQTEVTETNNENSEETKQYRMPILKRHVERWSN